MLPLIAQLLVFGVALPWLKGVDFLDPVMTGAYVCLGGLFAAPYAAQSFGNRPQNLGMAVTAALKSAGFGEGVALAMLFFGILTVNLSHPGRLSLPELDTLAKTALLGLTMTCAFAFGAGWLTLKFSANAARRVARFAFLGLAIAFYYESRWLPDVALKAAGIFAILAVGFFLLLKKEVSVA